MVLQERTWIHHVSSLGIFFTFVYIQIWILVPVTHAFSEILWGAMRDLMARLRKIEPLAWQIALFCTYAYYSIAPPECPIAIARNAWKNWKRKWSMGLLTPTREIHSICFCLRRTSGFATTMKRTKCWERHTACVFYKISKHYHRTCCVERWKLWKVLSFCWLLLLVGSMARISIDWTRNLTNYVECVPSGGGIIVLLLRTVTSLQQFYSMVRIDFNFAHATVW